MLLLRSGRRVRLVDGPPGSGDVAAIEAQFGEAMTGRAAQPVLHVLDPLIDKPQRGAVCLSDDNAAMRADEVRLARALLAR
jgi:hypothetical protein